MTSVSVRPYGDTAEDGTVQVSFTLPVPNTQGGEAAASALARSMGLADVIIAHSRVVDAGFTFFVAYGSFVGSVEYDPALDEDGNSATMTTAEVDAAITQALSRRLVIVGACIGTDAHTVGIDAILNIKGFGGEKGLEYYHEFDVVNMGAQVAPADLVERAALERADVLLVSQVVTQNEAHIRNIRALTALLSARTGSWNPLVVIGGPRMSADMTEKLNVDRIFGRGTSPHEVACYLAEQVTKAPRRFTGLEPSRSGKTT